MVPDGNFVILKKGNYLKASPQRYVVEVSPAKAGMMISTDTL